MTALTIILVISIILLFVSMVLSAIASSAAQKNNITDAHKYSMWSAIVSGLSIALLVIVLVLYLNSGAIISGVQSKLSQYQ
jgi:hypothetical protein